MRKFTHLIYRVTQKDSAACTDYRTFCFFKLRHHFLHLHRMSLDRRFICTEGHRLRIFEFLDRRLLNINRNIDQDRTFSSCICNIKCFLHNARDVIYIIYKVAVFYKRLCRTCNICFLEYITSDQFTLYLAGNADQRNTVRKSCRNSGNEVCRTWAACHCADAHLSCYAGHTTRRVGRILLRSYEDSSDIRIQHSIVKRTDCHTRITKYHFYAFVFKALNHRLCTIHGRFPPLCQTCFNNQIFL